MSVRKILVATLLAATLVAGVVATASARGKPFRTDGTNASTYWTQVDGPPAADPTTQPFGNVHVGWLDVWQTSTGKGEAFAWIEDFRCPEGVLPYHGGHGEEPTGPTCEWIGSRNGYGKDMAFTIDKKLTTARLTGRLTMTAGGHGGDGTVVGNPKADITWKGTGNTYRSAGTYRSSDGASRWMDRYTYTSRQATMGGILGPMGFDPALSGGSLSSYRGMYKYSGK